MSNNPFFEGYTNQLVKKLYGLLCERENNGEWIKYLDSITIEVIGLESELDSINYWQLRGKLGSLHLLSYPYFRKTIFECINLIKTFGID